MAPVEYRIPSICRAKPDVVLASGGARRQKNGASDRDPEFLIREHRRHPIYCSLGAAISSGRDTAGLSCINGIGVCRAPLLLVRHPRRAACHADAVVEQMSVVPNPIANASANRLPCLARTSLGTALRIGRPHILPPEALAAPSALKSWLTGWVKSWLPPLAAQATVALPS